MIELKELNLRNITLMAAVAGNLIQIGAQLFALSVVASTVSAAPPRSFAILEGAYRYDSEAFWKMAPLITFLLLVIAVGANWKTPRRKFLLFALTLFISSGLLAGLFLEPMFNDMKAMGFRDEIDPLLQSRAAAWYLLDWVIWGIGAIGGASLLLAIVQPVALRAASSPTATPSNATPSTTASPVQVLDEAGKMACEAVPVRPEAPQVAPNSVKVPHEGRKTLDEAVKLTHEGLSTPPEATNSVTKR